MAIVRNAAYCGRCAAEVVSKTRHDFVTCPCGDVSVDGGHSYLRHLMRDNAAYENRSVTVTDCTFER